MTEIPTLFGTSRIQIDEEGPFVVLPAAMGFGDDVEVIIVRCGDVLTIYPKHAPPQSQP